MNAPGLNLGSAVSAANAIRILRATTGEVVVAIGRRPDRSWPMLKLMLDGQDYATIHPGAIVRARPSYGLDPPPCLGMIQAPPPRVAKGEYGVVALGHDRAFLNFVDPNALNLAFREGWIRTARR